MFWSAWREVSGRKNHFDVLLAFLIASLISRAIYSLTAFWGTIVLGLTIAVTIGKEPVAGDVKKSQGNYPEIGRKTRR
jgi:hypothetical protein